MNDDDVAAYADPPQAPASNPSSARPSYLLAVTTATIFTLEALVMIVFYATPPMPRYQEALIDASLLSLVVFPILYVVVFNPLRNQISLRVQLQARQDQLICRLQEALHHVKTLEGIIPICASCHQIRDDEGYWHRVEAYIEARSEARFSHGVCPECIRKHYHDVSIS